MLSAEVKSLRLKYSTKGIRCECSDPGCPAGHPGESCGRLATTRLWRVDMEDRTGTFMCNQCADDAYGSGLFRDRPVQVPLKAKYRNETTERLLEAARNDPSVMPILADALEDAGYRDQSVLKRLRRQDWDAFRYLED